ncbi:hypothetical protein UMZ34_20910 [Halopseudomonas pachastrellae]|nr:hypothetical protein UMZ34_20910 [Halopseudomonas pachastrellae]
MLYLSMAALAAVLLLFAWIGLRARSAEAGLDDFVTARNSQNARAIGLSFLASGMGGWILFAPPEVGALVGPLALAGYALGAALPFALFAALGPAIRRALPQGRSIGEFAEHFYGPAVRRWVGLISLLYMSCFFDRRADGDWRHHQHAVGHQWQPGGGGRCPDDPALHRLGWPAREHDD